MVFASRIRAEWSRAMGNPGAALEGFARNLTTSMIKLGDFAYYDVAGITVALEQLGQSEAALEIGALVEQAATDWGTTPDGFSFFLGGLAASMERARSSLPAETARAAEARGRGVSSGARTAYALAVAREVLAARGVG